MKITKAERRALNRARTILKELEKRSENGAYGIDSRIGWQVRAEARSLGRLAEAAEIAEERIFQVLNCARSRCGVEITDDEMFNRQPGED